ncbi:uncharacterized protein LOC115754104 [Rhodamnia argentea]|uniref:Uncharacterized protein LOC115754104 n=1 Tax=Rhodamnia argentea TaxID=178133 RepID=A0A8B8QRI5_9MYRT|nr:uncharacterized protein LOC115754104 [Rhodamnia argentea]
MVVSRDESRQDPEPESIVGHLQDPTREEEEEEDEAETLSLCDLPLYSDSAEWDKDGFSKVVAEPERAPRGASAGSCQDQEDLFEFSSSEDWSVSSGHHSGHVIFCGKLIPYGEPLPVVNNPDDLIGKRSAKPKKRRFFRWKLRLFRKSRTSYSYRRLRADKKKRSKQPEVSHSKNLPLEKLGSLDGSARKAGAKGRWYFLVFGSTRFPMEMELSDMRMRQSRRRQSPASMFQSMDSAEKKYPRNWGLWRLLRTLSCSRSNNNGGDRPTTSAVKASPDELHSNSRG